MGELSQSSGSFVSWGMTSFRSKHFPRSRNPLVVLQEQAMRYYTVMVFFVMLGIMVRVYTGKEILWFGILGMALSILLGNLIAYVQLRRNIAEIFFVNDHFSLISVYEILYGKENLSFPLMYANPNRTESEITLHFNDQVIVLKQDDWEDFDLIWGWLVAKQL